MVMFFGLCNSPSTFQAMMDWIFRLIIDKREPRGTKVGKYMDDCYDSFFLPYYTQIHRTAFFPLSPILS